MAAVRMKTDLHPLCYRHHTAMDLVALLVQAGPTISPKPAYACQVTGCTAHYDIGTGYFDCQQGQGLQRAMTTWVTCPHDGLPMFIAEFQPQTNEVRWNCAQSDCEGTRSTKGSLPGESK